MDFFSRTWGKPRHIPENLVYADHFEIAISSITPEEYGAHLEQQFENNLILIAEDAALEQDGLIPHTRYAIRHPLVKNTRFWFVGMIYTTDQDEILVTMSVGFGRWFVAWVLLLPVLVILYTLVTEIGEPIGEIVKSIVLFGIFFLILYVPFYAGVLVIKRNTLRMLSNVPDDWEGT